MYKTPHTDRPSLDPFCPSPFSQSDQSETIDCLKHFFTLISRQNLPFEDIGTRNELAHGWFECALLEEAASFAFLSYWAKMVSGMSQHTGLQRLSVKFELRTLATLRHRIESGSAITEEILLTATVHYVSAALDLLNCLELRRMLRGIKALVDNCGGMDQVLVKMKPSTIFSVQYTDILNSLVNADEPLFVEIQKPRRPPSFSSIHNPRPSWDLARLASHLDGEVLDTMQLIEFLLCFRHPSRQTRSLSVSEFDYIRSLEYWLNYQLGSLQHKYVNTGLVEEIVVVTMVFVKLEVVAEGSQHQILVRAILDRLQRAIISHDSPCPVEDSELLIMSACIMSLVRQDLLTERAWFLDRIRASLVRRYGALPGLGPTSAYNELKDELQQFLWHPRIEICFLSVCAELKQHDGTGDLFPTVRM